MEFFLSNSVTLNLCSNSEHRCLELLSSHCQKDTLPNNHMRSSETKYTTLESLNCEHERRIQSRWIESTLQNIILSNY